VMVDEMVDHEMVDHEMVDHEMVNEMVDEIISFLIFSI